MHIVYPWNTSVDSCALLVSARSLSNAVKKVPCDHLLGIRPFPILPTYDSLVFNAVSSAASFIVQIISPSTIFELNSSSVRAVAFRCKLRA